MSKEDGKCCWDVWKPGDGPMGCVCWKTTKQVIAPNFEFVVSPQSPQITLFQQPPAPLDEHSFIWVVPGVRYTVDLKLINNIPTIVKWTAESI